jgi:hypothetical protein
MLALSDQQLAQVKAAATLLPVNARDLFLRSVAGRLSDITTPTDNDVAAAVSFVLSCRGISMPMSFGDGAVNEKFHGNVSRRCKL